MAGQIIISNIKTDSDNAFSILANTGAVLFSANLASGITTGIADGSVTNAKLAGSITGDKIATGQITGNLLTANCVSGNNIVSSPTITGNVTINGSLGIGGATPASSGFGITFPATQVPSADANTLDDYEEGTWTPSLSGAGGTAGSYAQSAQSGNYIKIGKLVWVWGSVAISNKGSWSSSVYFTLPFTPEGQVQGTGAVRSQLHTFSGTLVCEYSTSGSFGRFNVTSSGGSQTNLDWSAISQTAGNYLSFSLVYQQA